MIEVTTSVLGRELHPKSLPAGGVNRMLVWLSSQDTSLLEDLKSSRTPMISLQLRAYLLFNSPEPRLSLLSKLERTSPTGHTESVLVQQSMGDQRRAPHSTLRFLRRKQ